MYEGYMLKDRNQNQIPVLIQEAADFLMQIGRQLNDAGRVLASIGDGLFAVGQILLFFDTDKRLSDDRIQIF
jgi:hypothetical protein